MKSNTSTQDSKCVHEWENDPAFEDGAVIMFTSMQGEEMRQYCKNCDKVRYIPKETCD